MTSEHAPAPKSADAIVGEQVHHWMWRARVSQTELAKHLGISQTNVSRRLRGETGWTVDDLLICARVLSVPPGDLLPGADYDPSPRRAEGDVGVGYAIADSNREPADYKSDATILALPTRPHTQSSLPLDHVADVVTIHVHTPRPAGVESVIS